MSETTSEPTAPGASVVRDIASQINLVNPGSPVRNQDVEFRFRKVAAKDGKPAVEPRPAFKMTLPMPTMEAVLTELTHPDEARKVKAQNYLLDLISEQVINAAKEQVNDETNPVNSQDDLDLSLLSLTAIINQPPSARKGAAIAKEVWEQFEADYKLIMPGVLGKSEKTISNQLKYIMGKFNGCRTQKQIIALLAGYLGQYAEATKIKDDVREVLEYLLGRAKTLLEVTEEKLIEAL